MRQQLQSQQRQEVLRLLGTLTPEQREQLSRLPTAAQVPDVTLAQVPPVILYSTISHLILVHDGFFLFSCFK